MVFVKMIHVWLKSVEGLDMISRQMKVRFGWCIIFFMCAMTGLGSRLAFLQLGKHEAFCKNIEQTRRFEKEISVRRGGICDRNGQHNLLALDLAVQDVCAAPVEVVKSNAVLQVASCLSPFSSSRADESLAVVAQPIKRGRASRTTKWRVMGSSGAGLLPVSSGASR